MTKITIEIDGYRMVVEPDPERFNIKTLMQEKRLEIWADLDETPLWEVAK